MSKLAVFLCIALCASAANATVFRHTLQRAYERIGNRIDATIIRVREKFESIQQKAQALIEKIIQNGSQACERVRDKLNNELRKLENAVQKLTGRAKGVDVNECTKLAAHVDDVALAVITNMSMCVNGKLETAAGYVESIVDITAGVMANLTSIREKAFLCGANVNDIPSAVAAVACANRAAARATWVAAKVVPVMTVKITRLTFLLATLPPSLAYCTARNGIITVSKESSVVLGKIKKCIREKVEGVRATTTTERISTTEDSTPEITHTTEESTTELGSTAQESTTELTSKAEESTTELSSTTEESTPESTSTTEEATLEITHTTEASTPESTSTTDETTAEVTYIPEESTSEISYTTEEPKSGNDLTVW